MTWLEIFGWFMAFSIATSLFYRKGVKAGIKHAMMTLNLEQHQVEKLDKELEKDSYDLAMESIKEELSSKNDKLLN